MLKNELQSSKSAWKDLSVSTLLLQNQFLPILSREGLAEYEIKNVGFGSLIEFRSKMGFKFSRVSYNEVNKEVTTSVIMHEKTEE